MRIEDSRRLTGPSLLSEQPGAVLEVLLSCPDEAQDQEQVLARLAAAWQRALGRMCAALGLGTPAVHVRRYVRGVSLGFDAPVDVLYAATEINDWAAATAAAELGMTGVEAAESEPDARARLAAALAQEASPDVRALVAEAEARGLPHLIDDDAVTLGHGRYSVTYDRGAVPQPGAVAWDGLGGVATALVTGTNGKTTSVRLAARILAAAGHTVGCTLSDGIYVAGELVQSGDWTGPGAARQALRDPRVTAAVLETARGGYLRRGLAVRACDAVLVTNIAADHLGEYGVDSVDDMAAVKLAMTRVVRPGGRVVLNAQDPHLIAHAQRCGALQIVWFSRAPDDPLVAAHSAAGGEAVVARDGWIELVRGSERERVIAIAEVPLTFGGSAGYNVANALGAAGLGMALGVGAEALAAGLAGLRPTVEDTPGRANCFEVGEVMVMLDFAHNPHGVAALFEFVRAARPRGGRIAILGQAGDRDDQALCELAQAVVQGGVEHVVLRPLHGYLRGRSLHEVSERLAAHLRALGLDATRIAMAGSEAEAVDRALERARPGDVVMLLVHVEREPVLQRLVELGAVASRIDALQA